MKKVCGWLIAIIACLVSFIAMCLFDALLSLVYYFIGKVPFLSDIIDFIGEILDLGLTALVAGVIATFIWKFGHTLVEKVNGKTIEFRKGPVYYFNMVFALIFIAVTVFLGVEFFSLIGDAVTAYTAGYTFAGKVLMFFEAVKDTFLYVCGENIILYKIGFNSCILAVINIFIQ